MTPCASPAGRNVVSKTAQRKNSFYMQGYTDFVKGRGFRWGSHPYLEDYSNGWKAGKADVLAAMPEDTRKAIEKRMNPWWKRLLRKVGIHV